MFGPTLPNDCYIWGDHFFHVTTNTGFTVVTRYRPLSSVMMSWTVAWCPHVHYWYSIALRKLSTFQYSIQSSAHRGKGSAVWIIHSQCRFVKTNMFAPHLHCPRQLWYHFTSVVLSIWCKHVQLYLQVRCVHWEGPPTSATLCYVVTTFLCLNIKRRYSIHYNILKIKCFANVEPASWCS